MRKPADNSLIDWLGAATEDLADSLARLNRHLDQRETNPNWSRQAVRDSLDLLSLRRWAFLLPGGGAVRRGRVPRIIRPADNSSIYRNPPSPRRGVYPATPPRGVYPAVEEVES